MKNIKIIIILFIFYFFIIGSKKEQFSENISEPEETPDCSCIKNDGNYIYGHNCEKHKEEYNWCYTIDNKCGISGEKNWKECGLGPNLLQRLDLIDELKKSQDESKKSRDEFKDELKKLRELDAQIGIGRTDELMDSSKTAYGLNAVTIGEKNIGNMIAPYLEKMKNLKILGLIKIGLGQGPETLDILFDSLTKIPKLERLQLEGNDLQDRHINTLVNYLEKMTKLKILSLENNRFTNNMINVLFNSLKKMENFTDLVLGESLNNQATKLAWKNAGKEEKNLSFRGR